MLNLIPTLPEAIEKLNLSGSNKRWVRAKNEFDAVAQKHALPLSANPSRQSFLDSIRREDLDVIVVAAHGDRDSIYFPDGSRVTVEDILNLPVHTSDNPPVVILISCNTGRADQNGINTIAQALLFRRRATAVVAPTSFLPASSSAAKFLDTLLASGETSAYDALKTLRGPWQLFVEESAQVRPTSYLPTLRKTG